MEIYMGKKRTIVVTAYGHGKTIDKIAVSSFHGFKKIIYNDKTLDDANAYCNTINSLELKGDSWVHAKILTENTHYALDSFLPLNFSDIIMRLDNLAVQRVLREVDFHELIKSLKDQNETVMEKIFANMSERASRMLKEDMEVMKPVMINDIKESQDKILMIIQYLEEAGEIIIPYRKGETTK
jgi:flagellar motor switch protein FliG